MNYDTTQSQTADASPNRIVYRKGSIRTKLDTLLPNWPSFDVIAYELWADDGGGYSVNDSWHMGRGVDRETAIEHLANRWEIFKLNYAPRATVRGLSDSACDDLSPCYLESDCTPFAEVRKGGEE